MKLFFLILPIAICQFDQAPERSFHDQKRSGFENTLPDTIKWSSNYKLTFKDFKQEKANPIYLKYDSAHPNLLAYSHLGVVYDLKMEKQKLVLYIYAAFQRSKSWMSCNDERVLGHEQTHFDIAEIYARKFRKRTSDHQNNDSPTFWEDFEQINKEIQQAHLDEQHYFDNIAVTKPGEDFYIKKVQDELAKMDTCL